MPLPLIPLAVVGVVAAAGAIATAVGVRAAASPADKSVAVLGAKGVGKTTLLEGLCDRRAGAGAEDNDNPAKEFTFDANGTATKFAIVDDVSGDPQAKYAAWKDAYHQSDLVLYLFRADLIEVRDAAHIDLVRNHLALLKQWSDAMGKKAPRLVLVGTWADRSPAFLEDAERYAKRVRASDPIKLGRKKFKTSVTVVTGSLGSEHVEKLLTDLEQAVVGSRKASEQQ
ncbi:GTPase domain-containing protein [Microbacterium sp. 2216-1]|uniref:GTPase domain-containing protein n=1 Tax=Microbacterium sp. 2216-1 TaxID=3390053 RepID=UPI003974BC1E